MAKANHQLERIANLVPFNWTVVAVNKAAALLLLVDQ